MPTAPGLIPDVNPSLEGTPDLNIGVPVDAFGGAVGQALSNLGGDISHASDQIWQRAVDIQNLNNETSAKDADAQYMIQSGKLHADFLNKEGTNAGPDALAKHIQDLQDLRTNIRQGLNPMAAKMYDASSLSFMGRNIFNAAGHSGQQMKVASNNASTARKAITMNNIEFDPDDETTFQRGVQVVKSENARIADNNGWSPEQLEATNQDDLSKYWSKRILAAADNNGALKAQVMLNQAIKNHAIDPDRAAQVQNSVTNKIADQGSRSITDKVLGAYRDGEENKTEQEYVDEGINEVKAVKGLTDNQQQALTDKVRTSVSSGYHQQKTIQVQQQQQDYQTLTKALDTPDPNGMLPVTNDQLKARNPDVATALDRMKPTQQRAIGNRLLANAMGKTVIPTEENQARYKTLLGMSDPQHGDPNQFMSIPLYDENIPKFQRDQLLRIQSSMSKQAQSDPRVGAAMSYFNRTGLLTANSIDKKTNPDDYYNFVGALQDAISAQQHETGKQLKDDEIQKIGNQLLQEKGISKGYLWDSPTALYKTNVPEEDVKRIQADPYWKASNQVPTAQQIHNYYVREQYNKLFKGSPGASTNAVVPGTVSAPESQ